MQYQLRVEDVEPDHWVAWVLELPGCYSSANTQEDATAQAPTRIAEYFDWLKANGKASPLFRGTDRDGGPRGLSLLL